MADRFRSGRLLLPCLIAAVPAIAALSISATPQEAAFTGDIKPVLYVADVEASATFFRDVLGFEFDGFADRADGTHYYAEMLAADQPFGLHEPIDAEQESRIGKQRLYFRVRDVEAHRRRVVAAGGRASDIERTDWMDFFIVRDPDGHEIVFAETDPERHTIDPW